MPCSKRNKYCIRCVWLSEYDRESLMNLWVTLRLASYGIAFANVWLPKYQLTYNKARDSEIRKLLHWLTQHSYRSYVDWFLRCGCYT